VVIAGLLEVPTASAAGAAKPVPAAATLAAEVAALHAELASLRQELAALRQAQLDAAAPGSANAARLATAEERLATLAAAVAGLDARLTEVDDRNAETADTVAGLEQAVEQDVHLGIYGSLVGIDATGSTSAFDAESFELVLSGRPHPRLGYFAELEFEQAASVGGARGGEVILEQAWASYAISPFVNLRAGVLLMPFGNVSVDHYAPKRDVISKPLTAVVVAPSDWTDNGIGLYGRRLLGGEWSFNYELDLVAGLGADLTALGTRAGRQPFGVDNNNDKALVGRGALHRGDLFELGVSAYHGAYDAAGRLDLAGWALDGQLNVASLRLTGEVNELRGDRARGPNLAFRGWYGRAAWDFGRSWLRHGWHGKAFPEAFLSLVAQYDEVTVRGPLGDAFLTSSESRSTLGLNYRPSHQWVLKVDYEHSQGRGLRLVRGDSRAWLAAVGFVF
jgi:opacity protein-like surface antigen